MVNSCAPLPRACSEKKGEQFFTGVSFGYVVHFLHQGEVFVSQQLYHVFDDGVVEETRRGTGGDNLLNPKEEHHSFSLVITEATLLSAIQATVSAKTSPLQFSNQVRLPQKS